MWLTIPQAAARLAECGYPYSEDTIRSWIRRGHLPATRGHHGKRTRVVVHEDDLVTTERLVRQRTKPAQRVALACR